MGRTWQDVKNVGATVVKAGKLVIAGVEVGIGYVTASANLAHAQLTPNFTLDFAQAETDFNSAALSVLTFTLVVYGFHQLWKLIRGR
ncbi:hypothetical protein JYT60_00110, partial [bacterium AH-315-C08]|nr:hypothetical protein [bacterium AH-315-C08]